MSKVDVTGLPTFYVNKILVEPAGGNNILLVCGMKRGDEFTPLYCSVVSENCAYEGMIETATILRTPANLIPH